MTFLFCLAKRLLEVNFIELNITNLLKPFEERMPTVNEFYTLCINASSYNSLKFSSSICFGTKLYFKRLEVFDLFFNTWMDPVVLVKLDCKGECSKKNCNYYCCMFWCALYFLKINKWCVMWIRCSSGWKWCSLFVGVARMLLKRTSQWSSQNGNFESLTLPFVRTKSTSRNILNKIWCCLESLNRDLS